MTTAMPTIIKSLFELAEEISEFANEETERLDFDDYDNLTAYEAKMLAFGNLLAVTDKRRFLEEELAEARDYLSYLKTRVAKYT
jgi:hypothetical protein